MKVTESQSRSFLKHLLADIRTQRIFANHIDFTAEEVFKILLEADNVEQATARFKPHEKIDIAIRSFFTTRGGSK